MSKIGVVGFVKKHIDILQNPKTVIISVILGIFTGIYFGKITKIIDPVGTIYLNFLQMIVTVLLPVALITSIGEMAKKNDNYKILLKIAVYFIIFSIGISTISLITAFVSKNITKPDFQTKKSIGKMLVDKQEGDKSKNIFIKETTTTFKEEEKKNTTFDDLLYNIVPSNVFNALSNGDSLKIIFVSIFFGLMIRFMNQNSQNTILSIFEGLSNSIDSLINFAMYLLPFGLFSLMASQFDGLPLEILFSIFRFVFLILLISFVIIFISSLIIWKCTNVKYFNQFIILKEAIVAAVATSDGFAAVPATLKGLIQNMKLNKESTTLVVSLSTVLIDFSFILLFAGASFYSFMLYDISFGIDAFIQIIFLSIIATLATLSVPEILGVTMISVVLNPFGIPSEGIIVMSFIAAPILDPILTLMHVYVSCAVSAVVSKKGSEKVVVDNLEAS